MCDFRDYSPAEWDLAMWLLAEARWYAEDFSFFTRTPDFQFPWGR